jgi:hypothetical protein
MKTLYESILTNTKSKTKTAKDSIKDVTDEVKNLPDMSDFKLWDKKQWRLEWKCPNLIQLALDNCGRCNNPLLNEPVGFLFTFAVNEDTIYLMTMNKRGIFFPIMGWDKIEGISGNDNHRKKVILEIIKKLSDIDKMTELFDHYNKFCFRKESYGKSLLNDL